MRVIVIQAIINEVAIQIVRLETPCGSLGEPDWPLK